jgi:hypothetical protein
MSWAVNRPISVPHPFDNHQRERYSFPVEILIWEAKAVPRVSIRADGLAAEPSSFVTILFIPLSAAQYNLETDWAEAGADFILRRCPICSEDSIIGHGRRRKQAHDEQHDWIGIRRGLCNRCGETFTFLPPFSPPYGHYSFLARSQALRRYFLEDRSWEDAAPAVKNPDRVADPSTLRRWFRSLDASQPPFSFLRQTMVAIHAWLSRSRILVHDSLPLHWHTIFPFLARFWPLRI